MNRLTEAVDTTKQKLEECKEVLKTNENGTSKQSHGQYYSMTCTHTTGQYLVEGWAVMAFWHTIITVDRIIVVVCLIVPIPSTHNDTSILYDNFNVFTVTEHGVMEHRLLFTCCSCVI